MNWKIKLDTPIACTYMYRGPLDDYGRPGGFNSLADLPISSVQHSVKRQGFIEEVSLDNNDDTLIYKVSDEDITSYVRVLDETQVQIDAAAKMIMDFEIVFKLAQN